MANRADPGAADANPAGANGAGSATVGGAGDPFAADLHDQPWLPRPWQVRAVRRDTQDTVTFEIEAPDAFPAGLPLPGQFMMLYAFGIGESAISLSGIEGPRHLQHTVRDVGAVTHALANLRPGDTLGVRGPFGSSWPVAQHTGRDIVIAAGGIGLAPLRPLIEYVRERRERYDDVVVLYGARQPDDVLYAHEFDRWRAAGIQVEVTVDRADAAWNGHVGVVTTLIRYARCQFPDAAAFLCGPEIMMRFMAQELVARGTEPESTYLSMERNMKCAIGMCGHCQLGPEFICLDGPVFPLPRMAALMEVPEL
jgi:NAD(P)H-flavin reductase